MTSIRVKAVEIDEYRFESNLEVKLTRLLRGMR